MVRRERTRRSSVDFDTGVASVERRLSPAFFQTRTLFLRFEFTRPLKTPATRRPFFQSGTEQPFAAMSSAPKMLNSSLPLPRVAAEAVTGKRTLFSPEWRRRVFTFFQLPQVIDVPRRPISACALR